MKKAEAIQKAHGLGQLAAIFEISKSAISQWPEEIPAQRIYELKVKRPEWFDESDATKKPEPEAAP